MIEKKWNNDWKFWLDKDSFALVWDIPENAEKITIPHDAMIAKQVNPDSLNRGNTGFRDGDIYTYVKMLYVSDEYKEKVIKLKFEGVYMNAFVYVNGQLAAKSPFGYTTFYATLGDFLKYGEENEIRVQARSGAMTNSRWYSGAGIYRDVYLLESGLTYIESEGVKIKTENADKEYAVLNVNAELVNKASHPKDAVLQTVIYDQEGNEIAHESTVITLFGQDSISIKQRIAIESPKLWSADNPYLYRYETRLYDNSNAKKILDETFGDFGIRTIEVDSKRGLRINGQAVKLRG